MADEDRLDSTKSDYRRGSTHVATKLWHRILGTREKTRTQIEGALQEVLPLVGDTKRVRAAVKNIREATSHKGHDARAWKVWANFSAICEAITHDSHHALLNEARRLKELATLGTATA